MERTFSFDEGDEATLTDITSHDASLEPLFDHMAMTAEPEHSTEPSTRQFTPAGYGHNQVGSPERSGGKPAAEGISVAKSSDIHKLAPASNLDSEIISQDKQKDEATKAFRDSLSFFNDVTKRAHYNDFHLSMSALDPDPVSNVVQMAQDLEDVITKFLEQRQERRERPGKGDSDAVFQKLIPVGNMLVTLGSDIAQVFSLSYWLIFRRCSRRRRVTLFPRVWGTS